MPNPPSTPNFSSPRGEEMLVEIARTITSANDKTQDPRAKGGLENVWRAPFAAAVFAKINPENRDFYDLFPPNLLSEDTMRSATVEGAPSHKSGAELARGAQPLLLS
jgi:hypothetical protein